MANITWTDIIFWIVFILAAILLLISFIK